MGSSADQWLECLVFRQGSKQGSCFNFPGEFGGRLRRIQVSYPRPTGGIWALTTVWLRFYIEEALRTPEGEIREEQSHPRCLRHQSFQLSCSLHNPRLSQFLRIIIKGLLMWLLHTQYRQTPSVTPSMKPMLLPQDGVKTNRAHAGNHISRLQVMDSKQGSLQQYSI